MKIHNGDLTISEKNQSELFNLEEINGSLIISENIDVNLPGLKKIRQHLAVYYRTNVILNDLEVVGGYITLNYHTKLYTPTYLTVVNLKLVKKIILYPNSTILIKNSEILKNVNIEYYTNRDIILPLGKVITTEDFKTFNEKYFNH